MQNGRSGMPRAMGQRHRHDTGTPQETRCRHNTSCTLESGDLPYFFQPAAISTHCLSAHVSALWHVANR